MTVAANITLADAQATPVNHVFVPLGPDKNGVFWFSDQSALSAIGYWKISVEIKQPPAATSGSSSDGRSFRFKVGLHQPVLEVLSSGASGILPAPTLSYTPRAFIEYIVPERGSILDRKNLRKMISTLAADSNIVSVVENLVYLT